MSPALRLAIAAGFLMSGATGLVYEVVWARMLTLTLGAGSVAHVVVLSTFFGGIALGNAVLGRAADARPRRALALYAALEAIIALWGAASPLILTWADRTWRALTPGATPGPAMAAAEALLAALCLIVPTVAMGGTLPALARFVVARRADVGRDVGSLYALNALGAAAGAALGGLWLLPRLGATGAVHVAALANLIVAIGAAGLWLDRRAPDLPESPEDIDTTELDGLPESHSDLPESHSDLPESHSDDLPESHSDLPESHSTSTPESHSRAADPTRPWWLPALLCGFASLVLEVAWIRLFAIVFGSSAQAFTLMLVAFLLGIAGGGAIAARWLRTRPERGIDLALGLLTAAIVLLVVQLPFYERLPWLQFRLAWALERRADVYPVLLAGQTALAVAWMLPVTLATGAVLPTLVHVATRSVARLGGSLGRIFAANTVGTVVGPAFATFALMPLLGLRGTIIAGAGALATAAAAIARADARLHQRRERVRIALLAGLVAFAVLLPAWNPAIMHAGGFRRWTIDAGTTFAEFRELRGALEVVYAEDGPLDSVVVLRNADGANFLKVNGKTDASDTPDLATMRLVAHLPLLLHRAAHGERHREVYIVGVGAGITVGTASLHPDVHIVAAELSGGVLEASRFFAHVNGDMHADPDVDLVHADARELLARDDRRWDVIINQPSNPWIAGNAALFSREFFQLAASRLAEGGLMTQWMHTYAMDDDTLALVLDTFSSVFPYVTVWWPQAVDMVVIGSFEPLDIDADRLGALLDDPAIAASMRGYPREGLETDTLPRLLALQVLSERGFRDAFPGRGPWHTDAEPRLEVHAPRAQFVGQGAERFVELDERAVPGRPSRLWLSRLDLTEADERDLLAFFASRETAFAVRLAGSLQHAVFDVDSAADHADLATRGTGLPVLLDEFTRSVALADALDEATCQRWADAALRSYPFRASVFYRPDLSGAADAFERCAELVPDRELTWRALHAQLLAECGYRAEARRAIAALRAGGLPERADELLADLLRRLDVADLDRLDHADFVEHQQP